jgi:hypothetical protein
MKLECQGFFVAPRQGILSNGRIIFFSRGIEKVWPSDKRPGGTGLRKGENTFI